MDPLNFSKSLRYYVVWTWAAIAGLVQIAFCQTQKIQRPSTFEHRQTSSESGVLRRAGGASGHLVQRAGHQEGGAHAAGLKIPVDAR